MSDDVDQTLSPSESVARATTAPKPSLRRRLLAWGFSLAWAGNLGLLAAAVAWIATDGQFMEPVTQAVVSTSVSPTVPGAASGGVGVLSTTATLPMSPDRMQALNSLVISVLVTLTLMLLSLFVGVPRQRRLRSWLAFTALFAAWLGLSIGWPDLAWAGKTYRTRRLIDQFEPVAAGLRDKWPDADDYTEQLGPFSAYPNGRPRILMPLLKPSARGSHAPFSVIERSEQGALRFELLGPDAGACLEWHPAGSAPASFTGGLETDYRLYRSTPLADGWYLTRYHAAGLAKSL